jgi:hypothetical protein
MVQPGDAIMSNAGFTQEENDTMLVKSFRFLPAARI